MVALGVSLGILVDLNSGPRGLVCGSGKLSADSLLGSSLVAVSASPVVFDSGL